MGTNNRPHHRGANDERTTRGARASHQVLGVFDTMSQAHHAIEVLERSGIDAGEIVLVRPEGEQLAEGVDKRPVTKPAMATLFKRAAIGGAIGLPVGILIALIVAAIGGLDSIWLSIAVGSVGGVFAGSAVGAMAGVALSDAWERSFDSTPGRVAVAVGSDEQDHLDTAHQVLDKCEPLVVIDLDEPEGLHRQEVRQLIANGGRSAPSRTAGGRTNGTTYGPTPDR